MSGPLLTELSPWDDHERRVLDMLRTALVRLRDEGVLGNEDELSRELLDLLRPVNRQNQNSNSDLWLDEMPIWEARNPPTPDTVTSRSIPLSAPAMPRAVEPNCLRTAHSRTLGDSFSTVLAIDGNCEGLANLCEPVRAECADALRQVACGHHTNIVEACGAFLRQPVMAIKANFGRDVADCAGQGHCDHSLEHIDGRISRHHQVRTPPGVFMLAPPHLAATRNRHHGSSRMESRKNALAARNSSVVVGMRR